MKTVQPIPAFVAVALLTLLLQATFAQNAERTLPQAGQKDATANSANDTIAAAITKIQADIERDTETLNELRDRIAVEREPLAKRRDELHAKVKEMRSQVAYIRQLRTQGEKQQAALEEQASAILNESQFLHALFSEYARAITTRMTTTDASFFGEQLRLSHKALAVDEDFQGFANAIRLLLNTTADINQTRRGGYIFAGEALDADGIARQGRFAVLGPIAYFTDANKFTGMATTETGSDMPAIYTSLPENAKSAIRNVVAGNKDHIPVDVTDGNAIKVAEAKPSFLEHIRQGGFVMLPLICVALLACILCLWKLIELASMHTHAEAQIDEIIKMLKTGDVEAAVAKTNTLEQPLRPLVYEAIRHRNASRDFMEEIMHEQVLTTLPKLERNLGTLAVLGGIAPLLGLLGTVTGMIHTFQLVTIFGSGDAKLLSGGISEALVTTETGLAIAIPVLLMHAFLARRARNIIASLERIAIGIVNQIKADSDSP